MQENLILVDVQDNPIGEEEKLRAHELGLLHRAFSIFIFNSKGELMLQQRALTKYHSGGLWTNTVCGHPRPGEDTILAAQRRLNEEMGFTTSLTELFTFSYRVPFPNGLTENEIVHVMVGRFTGSPIPNKEEAESWKWVDLKELQQSIKTNPELYTFWLNACIEEFVQKSSSYLGVV